MPALFLRLQKVILRLLKWGVWAGLGVSLTAAAVVGWQVWYGDVSQLEKTTILSRIEEETALYYLGGRRRIGSIFDEYHRSYVPISEVPAHMQNAIIAAEDKNFYSHVGVDPAAIFQAFWEGVRSGLRFRRGGSTITQQTVKNIVGDWEATFARKFREMIRALQLERMYSKSQIIEFYLNQFHVAGTGNGIGVAARYYFSKEVADLSLVEAAFIAGSVKSPSRYNPFIKKNKEAYQRAVRAAHERKNYVLHRMYEHNWISQDEYRSALEQDVPFEKGSFITSDVTLLRLIKQQLSHPEVLEALGLKHPRELGTAGLKVYTTIDSDLQRKAQLVMRRNLAKLETILSGYSKEDPEQYKHLKRLSTGDFAFGRVQEIRGSEVADSSLILDFGLAEGEVPPEALMRYGKLLDLSSGHEEGAPFHVRQVLKDLAVGDVVFTEIRDYDAENHSAVAELYRYPQISGGLLALDEGEVRAVISGFHTLGFHRAVQAKRQPGSVFKVPTLLAALQLRWTILDGLQNRRRVFSYQGHHYYPRPDHRIRFTQPSLIWAGMMSENLAFVHLAFHLLDQLSVADFKALLQALDLAPHSAEPPSRYHYRVARAVGVQLDRAGLEKYQLFATLKELQPDLIFRRAEDLIATLQGLWWGDGYESQLQGLYREDLEQYSAAEVGRRQNLARNNFLRYKKLRFLYQQDWRELSFVLQKYLPQDVLEMPEYQDVLQRFSLLKRQGKVFLIYSNIFDEELYKEEDDEHYLEDFLQRREERKQRELRAAGLAQDREEDKKEEEELPEWPAVEFKLWADDLQGVVSPLSAEDLEEIWIRRSSRENFLAERVLLDGKLPLHMLDYLDERIPQKVAELQRSDDPYDLEQYYQHHDFRVGLGLYYLAQLCQLLGVESRVEAVLSMPLGTNVVSVAEVAKVFQTFASGKLYRFFEEGPANQISYIKRVEDRHGKVIYEPQAEVTQILPPQLLHQLQAVLRKVVSHGTGRRAHGELYFDVGAGSQGPSSESDKIRIPAYGKTGTTNDFTTSYFAGFVPYPEEEGVPLSLKHHYTLAAYVGYDIPRTMKAGRVSIYGGTGALPLWTDFFKETIAVKNFASYLDAYDIDILSKNEWSAEPDRRFWLPLRVDLPRGLVLGKASEDYVEDYEPTNFSLTGEIFQDEHRISKSIQGELWVPQPLDMKNPLSRFFSPLTSQTLEQRQSSSPVLESGAVLSRP